MCAVNKLLSEMIDSANGLPAAEAEIADEMEELAELVALEIDRELQARPDLENLVGGKVDMMRNNHRNQVRYLASACRTPDGKSFVDTLLWVHRTYLSHGFRPEYWQAALPAGARAAKARLSPRAAGVLGAYYDWLLEHSETLVRLASHVPSERESVLPDLQDHHA